MRHYRATHPRLASRTLERNDDMSEPSPEVLAERERVYEIVTVLRHGLHTEALSQALKAIRNGKSRAELIPLGAPWRLNSDGSRYEP